MLVKIEASKEWSNYERVFDAHELKEADDIYETLMSEGWKVKWIPLGPITKNAFCKAVVWECFDKLDEIHSTFNEKMH